MVILLVRITARCWQIGLRWQGDDYFAILAVIFFTAELVMLELIGRYGSITGMSDEVALTLTPERTRQIVIGSKCLLAGWVVYMTLIWCRKYDVEFLVILQCAIICRSAITFTHADDLTTCAVKACMLFFYKRLT